MHLPFESPPLYHRFLKTFPTFEYDDPDPRSDLRLVGQAPAGWKFQETYLGFFRHDSRTARQQPENQLRHRNSKERNQVVVVGDNFVAQNRHHTSQSHHERDFSTFVRFEHGFTAINQKYNRVLELPRLQLWILIGITILWSVKDKEERAGNKVVIFIVPKHWIPNTHWGPRASLRPRRGGAMGVLGITRHGSLANQRSNWSRL